MSNGQRASDPVLVELLQMVTELNGVMKSHIHDENVSKDAFNGKLEKIHDDVELVRLGFPEDSPKDHREWHENEMQRIKERAEFWKKMSYELSKYGLLGFLGWAVYALWQAFLHGPGK